MRFHLANFYSPGRSLLRELSNLLKYFGGTLCLPPLVTYSLFKIDDICLQYPSPIETTSFSGNHSKSHQLSLFRRLLSFVWRNRTFTSILRAVSARLPRPSIASNPPLSSHLNISFSPPMHMLFLSDPVWAALTRPLSSTQLPVTASYILNSPSAPRPWPLISKQSSGSPKAILRLYSLPISFRFRFYTSLCSHSA